MGTIRYSLPVDDVTANATATTAAGTAETGYEAPYAVDFSLANLGHPARSNSAAGITVQLAFAAPQTLGAMLLWHSTDDDGIITVEADASPSFGSPPDFSTTVTVLPRRGDARTIKLWVPLDETYQYWRIILPTNTSAKPGLKVKCYAAARALAGLGVGLAGQKFRFNDRRTNMQAGFDHATVFDIHWTYDLQVGSEAVSGELTVNDADLAALKFWHQATGGRAPTLFVPDSDSAEAWLARIALGPSPFSQAGGPYASLLETQRGHPRFQTVTLTLEEIHAGGPEWA